MSNSTNNVEPQVVEIGGQRYQLTPLPASNQNDNTTTPAESSSTTSQSNAQSSTGPPSTLQISRQAIYDVTTGDIIYDIGMTEKWEWSLSSKSLVEVKSSKDGSLLGKLHFHSFEDEIIDIIPSNRSAFKLKKKKKEWICKDFPGNQRWKDVDDGVMRLIYDTTDGKTVEVARLNKGSIQFKKADLEGEGGYAGILLMALAMREQKIRTGEEHEALMAFSGIGLGVLGLAK
jgi:hypothetical protein